MLDSNAIAIAIATVSEETLSVAEDIDMELDDPLRNISR